MNTFAGYGDKSSAKRGFARMFKDLNPQAVDSYLDKQDGKWGFSYDEKGPILTNVPPAVTVQPLKETNPDLGVLNAMAGKVAVDVELELATDPSAEEDDAQDTSGFAPFDNTPTPSVFGRFATAQLTATPQADVAPAAAPARPAFTASKIEKDRPEANGVKRPSAGTICARIWDIAHSLSDVSESTNAPNGHVATLSEVVKAAEAFGINKFTARTQYARWRVFHGITGKQSS